MIEIVNGASERPGVPSSFFLEWQIPKLQDTKGLALRCQSVFQLSDNLLKIHFVETVDWFIINTFKNWLSYLPVENENCILNLHIFSVIGDYERTLIWTKTCPQSIHIESDRPGGILIFTVTISFATKDTLYVKPQSLIDIEEKEKLRGKRNAKISMQDVWNLPDAMWNKPASVNI